MMALQKSLIVVVDDDPGILKLVSLNLQLEGLHAEKKV